MKLFRFLVKFNSNLRDFISKKFDDERKELY